MYDSQEHLGGRIRVQPLRLGQDRPHYLLPRYQEHVCLDVKGVAVLPLLLF